MTEAKDEDATTKIYSINSLYKIIEIETLSSLKIIWLKQKNSITVTILY